MGRRYLRQQVDDPECAKSSPRSYAVGCKRPGFHNGYLSTFNRDNVRLVTEPIDKITPSAVATTDGEQPRIDVLILATGFKVMDTDSVPTYAVTGSGGQSLSRFWDEHRTAGLRGRQRSRIPELVHRVGSRTATSARRISR